MQDDDRTHHPIVQIGAGLLLGVVFVALYLGMMRATLNVSLFARYTANERDTVYLIVHGSILIGGALAGFGLGRWLGGLAVGYTVFIVVLLCVVMAGAMAGSQTLACHGGRNDVIRHWTC